MWWLDVIVPPRRRLASYDEARLQERHGESLKPVSVQVNGG